MIVSCGMYYSVQIMSRLLEGTPQRDDDDYTCTIQRKTVRAIIFFTFNKEYDAPFSDSITCNSYTTIVVSWIFAHSSRLFQCTKIVYGFAVNESQFFTFC